MTYQVLVYQLCFNFSLALITVINGPAKRVLLQIGVLVYQLCFNFSLALKTVINGPAKRVLLQIGAIKGAAETSACFPI